MLHFTERGRGPALLLIHACPLDSSMWDAQMAFFSDRYRVIAPDLPGFGGSQPPHAWTIPEMGEELANLMDRLGLETCTLAGLSIGGYIALPFALKHPKRVEQMILAHTRARADLDGERAARNTMIEGLRKDGTANLPDKMLPRLLSPETPDDVRNRVKAWIERTSAVAAVHALTAMRDRDDQTKHLDQLQCPTLVIAGSGDAIIPVKDCEQMAAAIPGSEIAVISQSGHLSNLENPAAFNQAVDRFLKRS
jgi:3-oxoadipate enol-lactonase